MRKKAIIFPAVAIAVGAAGAFLRLKAINTALDETGRLITTSPTVTANTFFAIGALVLMALFAMFSTRTSKNITLFNSICPQTNMAEKVLSVILALVMAYGGVSFFLANSRDIICSLFSLFVLLTAIAYIVIVFTAGNDSAAYARSITSLFPPIFCCLWLIVLFKTHAGNPIVFEYGIHCVAMASGAMAYFYMGSFIFGEGKFRRAVFMCLVGVFSGIISAADNLGAERYIFLVNSAALALSAGKLLMHRHRDEPDNPKAEKKEEKSK